MPPSFQQTADSEDTNSVLLSREVDFLKWYQHILHLDVKGISSLQDMFSIMGHGRGNLSLLHWPRIRVWQTFVSWTKVPSNPYGMQDSQLQKW